MLSSLGLKTKLVLTGILLAVLPLVVYFVVGAYYSRKMSTISTTESLRLANTDMEQTLNAYYSMCQAQNGLAQKMVDNTLNLARAILREKGVVGFRSDTVEWSAVNQYTKDAAPINLSKMTVGDQWLGKNSSFQATTPVVDQVMNLSRQTCTIFQRMNEQGDMLRVATNVKKLDGQRAIGTYIPAVNPNGNPNPVISAILKGETFRGRAFVVNAWYITAYEPIFDENKKIVGVLYVGIKQAEVEESLIHELAKAKIGAHGYMILLDSKAQLLLTENETGNRRDAAADQDADGNAIYQKIVEKSVNLQPDQTADLKYRWQDKDKSSPQVMYAKLKYFKPLDLVIGAVVHEDDYLNTTRLIEGMASKSLWLTGLWAVVILVLAGICTWLLSGVIVKPIMKAVDLARSVSEGDFSSRLHMTGKDEIGRLSESLDKMADGLESKAELAAEIAHGVLYKNVSLSSDRDRLGGALQIMVENLVRIVNELNMAVEKVGVGSNQINDSSQALAQGATEQAASLEEITSSITEIASQTKNNAENAGQASRLSQQASESAVKGNDYMRDMIEAMSEINDSSSAIARIIKTIDDIAFQTNLLALNAAVEAARAGVHGKGFAVVAQEVRSLAGRSAQAARETAELINGSVTKVEKGSEILNQTAAMLTEIVDGIAGVTGLVKEIAGASSEQAQGIEQINYGLAQVEKVTQKNVSAAEQSASASTDLAGQAVQLRRLVAEFKLEK